MGDHGFDAAKFVRDVFRPRSFAVLGASDEPSRIGGRPLAYTMQRFEGPIYPVNPKRETVQGLRAYPSVAEVDGRWTSPSSRCPPLWSRGRCATARPRGCAAP